MSNNITWIIGAGNMAKEYAKVLSEMKVEYLVIGRRENSAKNFETETGVIVIQGGIENYIKHIDQKPEKAIVCVNDEGLAETTLLLLNHNINSILVEKPGGLTINEFEVVAKKAYENKANVFIAYNRRFYASVLNAKKIIEKDGGVLSFNFEFTEWTHEIAKLNKSKRVLENWLLVNSSHVIDLAFYLGGNPKEIQSYISGGLNWHPSASIFAGAGISENGALFSYNANWEAPGRWGVEVLTKKRRLIFRPLEKLFFQEIGSLDIKEFPIDDELDKKFKPGLFLQIKNFLEGNTTNFCSIEQQSNNLKLYNKISNYKKYLKN